ncbi:MAG: RDD family protein [Phycisphaerales bacterium]
MPAPAHIPPALPGEGLPSGPARRHALRPPIGAALLLIAAALLTGAGLLPSASSNHAGWFVAPSGSGTGPMLHLLHADDEWNEIRPIAKLDSDPIALAAINQTLYLAFDLAGEPPENNQAPHSQPVLSVRATSAIIAPTGAREIERFRVLPPIPISAPTDPDPDSRVQPTPLVALAAARGSGPDGTLLFALLSQDDSTHTLLALDRTGWNAVPLPPDLAAEHPLHLIATGTTLAIIQRSNASLARVWSIQAQRLINPIPNPNTNPSAPDESTPPPNTSRSPIQPRWNAWTAPAPAGDFDLTAVDGQLVLITGVQGDGHRRITLLRPDTEIPITRILASPGHRTAVLALAGAVVSIVIPPDSQPGRPTVAAHTLLGVALYEGEAAASAPVDASHLGLLALMLLSLFGSVLVFVARPARTWNPPVNLPPGASLAPLGKRLLAFIFDLAPGMFASSILFPSGAGTGPLEPLAGLAPLLFVLLFTITHITISEALAARSLGKLVLGMRTITADGAKPPFHTALLRTTVKVLCPPLMAFTIANPYMPGPAGFGTIVIAEDPDHHDNAGPHDPTNNPTNDPPNQRRDR